MPSILEEFAYGNVSPPARPFKKDSKYGRALALVARIEDALLNRLEPASKDLFEKYVAAQEEADQLIAVDNLIYGYKLRLVMAAEAFISKADLYTGGEEL